MRARGMRWRGFESGVNIEFRGRLNSFPPLINPLDFEQYRLRIAVANSLARHDFRLRQPFIQLLCDYAVHFFRDQKLSRRERC